MMVNQNAKFQASRKITCFRNEAGGAFSNVFHKDVAPPEL